MLFCLKDSIKIVRSPAAGNFGKPVSESLAISPSLSLLELSFSFLVPSIALYLHANALVAEPDFSN